MKKINLSLLIVLSCSIGSIAQIESNDNIIPRKFGIGIKANVINLIDLVDNNISPARLLLIVTPIPNFRLEPEFGILSISDEKDNKIKGLQFGLGIYPMYQKDRTNIFGGLNINSLTFNSTVKSQFSPQSVETKVNRFAFGLKIGGEYFLGNQFSFGGEVGISSVKTKTNQESTELNTVLTESSLAVRFYF
jgi:hypothetical protein